MNIELKNANDSCNKLQVFKGGSTSLKTVAASWNSDTGVIDGFALNPKQFALISLSQ